MVTLKTVTVTVTVTVTSVITLCNDLSHYQNYKRKGELHIILLDIMSHNMSCGLSCAALETHKVPSMAENVLCQHELLSSSS